MVGNVELVIDLCRFTPKKETTEEDNKNNRSSRFLLHRPALRIRAMRFFSEQERFRMVLRLCLLAASTFV